VNETISLVYDGRVLRTDDPVGLEPDARCEIAIQVEVPSPRRGTFGEFLRSIAGATDGPGDWSVEHDHYLYGTPKRSTQEPG
jgi:hypothetical protein